MAAEEDDQPLLKKPRKSGSNSGCLHSASTSSSGGFFVKEAEGKEFEDAGGSTEPVHLTLADAGLLNCPICFDILSSPVYQVFQELINHLSSCPCLCFNRWFMQCKKGHVACATCCATFHCKCPYCSCRIGDIRCLIVEMIVESITVDCQNKTHGCGEKVSYANKFTHLKNCKYAPCHCPYPDCDFFGFSKFVYKHFSESHVADQYSNFKSEFDLKLNSSEECVFLQERNQEVVFVVTRSSEPRGSIIKVFCIAPVSSGSARTYDIQLSAGGGVSGVIMLTGPVQCIQEWEGQLPMTAYLMVPDDFIDKNRQFMLKVYIWDRG